MTCTDVRALLPVYTYGDLPAEEAAVVVGHLRNCQECRAEAAAVRRVRSALDSMPTPFVHVDVPSLFASIAERRVRRWRRLAVAGAALAAGLLVVLSLRLQVTVGTGQVVIRWGGMGREGEAPAEPTAVTARQEPRPPDAPRIDALEDRVQLVQELTRALATDVESRDRQRSADIAAVRLRLDAVQQYAARQWADAERTMSALYVAQFKRPEEKTNP
jgi:anti-sigma factor RsiW